MPITMALAGDTMLGRGVAERLDELGAAHPADLFSDDVREIIAAADLTILNLECCVSARGSRWEAPGKPFFFRAPPRAARLLTDLGVDCVTLANNHALDFGYEALADTCDHLACAGVTAVGAGLDQDQARVPAMLEAGGVKVAVIGVTDHPEDFAAGPDRPGVAYADLRSGVPDWLLDLVRQARQEADVVLVSPHWGPNMTTAPLPYVRRAARELLAAGATLIAGHSAHVFHGVSGPVLFDMGDFVDDYAVDPLLRNDLGLLFLVRLDQRGPTAIEAYPLALDYCHTRLAKGDERALIESRFAAACAATGTTTPPLLH